MRQATAGDIPRIADMASRFHKQVRPAWPWDRAAFEAVARQAPYLAVTDAGFLMGALAPALISPGWVQAHELLWWCEDNTGAAHMRAFRKWAKAQGANEILWSCQTGSPAGRVLGRIGKPTDTYFSEVL